MKNFALSAIALFALTSASASTITLNTTQIAGKDKPKTTAPAPGPSTDSIPPVCPYNDPNGCGILD